MVDTEAIPFPIQTTRRLVAAASVVFVLLMLFSVLVQFAPAILNLLGAGADARENLRDADRWLGLVMVALGFAIVFVTQAYQGRRLPVVLAILALLALAGTAMLNIVDETQGELTRILAATAKVIAVPVLAYLVLPITK
jgi:hypothetical protein